MPHQSTAPFRPAEIPRVAGTQRFSRSMRKPWPKEASSTSTRVPHPQLISFPYTPPVFGTVDARRAEALEKLKYNPVLVDGRRWRLM